ncbi:unnamed protein product, partial [Adineta steineri]
PQGDAIQHPAGIDRLDHLINKRSATTLNATCLTKAFKHYNHTVTKALNHYNHGFQRALKKYKTSVQTILRKSKTTVRGAHKVYDDTVRTALKKYKTAFVEAHDEYDNTVQRADEVYDNAIHACSTPTVATSCIADGEACTVGGPKCCSYADGDYVGLNRVAVRRGRFGYFDVYGCVVSRGFVTVGDTTTALYDFCTSYSSCNCVSPA